MRPNLANSAKMSLTAPSTSAMTLMRCVALSAFGRGYRIFRLPYAKRVGMTPEELDQRVSLILTSYSQQWPLPSRNTGQVSMLSKLTTHPVLQFWLIGLIVFLSVSAFEPAPVLTAQYPTDQRIAELEKQSQLGAGAFTGGAKAKLIQTEIDRDILLAESFDFTSTYRIRVYRRDSFATCGLCMRSLKRPMKCC